MRYTQQFVDAAVRRVPPPLATRDRIPVEFVGKARELRRKIAVTNERWLSAVIDLTGPLTERDGFVPTFTRQSMALLKARWHNLPEWGRLRVGSKVRGNSLQIAETRLTPFDVSMSGWSSGEPSIAVTLWTAIMRLPTTFSVSGEVLAAIGLHSLARRYERSDHRGDKAVLRDLFAIPLAFPEAMRARGEFEVSVPGGRWAGTVMMCENRPIMAVRTFKD